MKIKFWNVLDVYDGWMLVRTETGLLALDINQIHLLRDTVEDTKSYLEMLKRCDGKG